MLEVILQITYGILIIKKKGFIMIIPFNKPYYTGKEIQYIKQAMSNSHLSGDGYYTKKVNSFIEEKFKTKKSLFVTSGSSALDIAAILLDLKPEDEVIMPSYTFVSTANAVVLRGAKVVFADINPSTLNIEPEEIEKRITKKTKAIFPVHYAGVACDMDRIMKIAEKHNLKVVEDAAQGVNAKYKGRHLGSIGDIGCYSYHETKNYVCSEGGSILINYDENLAKKCEIVREKGTNRSQFFRGEVDKYTWVDIGSSYLASDMLAAFLYAQFEALDEINEKRKMAYEYYHNNLLDFEKKGLIKLPYIPKEAQSNYHMFYIILETEDKRNSVMDKLKQEGILAVFHYIPLHLSPMGKNMGYQKGNLPITEEYSVRLLRLPLYAGMKEEELNYIVKKLKNLF